MKEEGATSTVVRELASIKNKDESIFLKKGLIMERKTHSIDSSRYPWLSWLGYPVFFLKLKEKAKGKDFSSTRIWEAG